MGASFVLCTCFFLSLIINIQAKKTNFPPISVFAGLLIFFLRTMKLMVISLFCLLAVAAKQKGDNGNVFSNLSPAHAKCVKHKSHNNNSVKEAVKKCKTNNNENVPCLKAIPQLASCFQNTRSNEKKMTHANGNQTNLNPNHKNNHTTGNLNHGKNSARTNTNAISLLTVSQELCVFRKFLQGVITLKDLSNCKNNNRVQCLKNIPKLEPCFKTTRTNEGNSNHTKWNHNPKNNYTEGNQNHGKHDAGNN
jgi:hypothetical protein